MATDLAPRLPVPATATPSTGSKGSTGSTSTGASGRRSGWLTVLRASLERPLTSYYLLLVASGLLLTIGLIMVLSSSSVRSYQTYGDSYTLVRRQLMWVLIGLPVAWFASRMSLRWMRGFVVPAFAVSLGLLFATAVHGVVVNGNQNWLGVGSFIIQPSEVAKLAIILWAAHVYANKERRLGSLHQMVVPVVPGILLATGLVIVGRDLGTALVFFAILVGLLWVVGAPGRVFTMAILVISTLVAVLAHQSPERLARITTFRDPLQHFADDGWQAGHGLFALSSGGLLGEGIGASQQKWGNLPAAHTDFIFAVLGEELGLAGTLLVVVLFLTIAYAALRVARDTADPFVRYATFGIVVWLIGQMMINVGMVLALLPVIGIPLPLVSYGGSSLVPTLVALGLLVGFARREPEAAHALRQRRRRRSAGLSAS